MILQQVKQMALIFLIELMLTTCTNAILIPQFFFEKIWISYASTSTLPKLLKCRVTLRTNKFTIFVRLYITHKRDIFNIK